MLTHSLQDVGAEDFGSCVYANLLPAEIGPKLGHEGVRCTSKAWITIGYQTPPKLAVHFLQVVLPDSPCQANNLHEASAHANAAATMSANQS